METWKIILIILAIVTVGALIYSVSDEDWKYHSDADLGMRTAIENHSVYAEANWTKALEDLNLTVSENFKEYYNITNDT